MRTNDEIVSIIEKRTEEKGLSQNELARRVGMAKSAISRYFNRTREFPLNKINDFARVLDLKPEYMLGFENHSDINKIYSQLTPPRQQKVYQFAEYHLSEQQKVVNMEDYITKNLVGYVSAGTGEYQTEEINEEVHLPKDIVPEQQYDMVLKVNGTSMEPMFQDGEFIFVRKVEEFRSGQIGVFIIDGESYLKKAYIEDSHIRLVSLNKDYKDLTFTDDSRIELIGTVVM